MSDREKQGSSQDDEPANEELGLFSLESIGVVGPDGDGAADGSVAGSQAQDGVGADDFEFVGYRAPVARQVAGITYRQLDYWARTGIVVPSVRGAAGSGSQRLYSFKDILVLKIVKRLLDTGVSLQNVRLAVDHLHQRGVNELANVTLFSDGVSVYECTSGEEVVDLLRGGQGVFGIAVSGAMRELSGAVIGLPAERADMDEAADHTDDELTMRRKNRARNVS